MYESFQSLLIDAVEYSVDSIMPYTQPSSASYFELALSFPLPLANIPMYEPTKLPALSVLSSVPSAFSATVSHRGDAKAGRTAS